MAKKKQTKDVALSVKSISMSYGKNHVIDDIDLDVYSGETFGLIGLNGVGKTTLIKAILGLRDFDSGEISIGGLNRLDIESKKKISYLPERFEPPWFLKGLEFIKFSMSMYGVEFDEERVFKYSNRLALDHKVLSNRVNTYSKGMRQKLGILANILTNTSLLILDEPMSGLDPRARTLVKDVLMEIKAEKRTVFLSSHILSDMNEICDRVAVLNDKKLIYTGTPKGLRDEGKNDNIERAFMNLIEPAKAA